MSASTAVSLDYSRVISSPAGPWIMHQNWHDLLFAHWPVPVEALRPYIPTGLSLDTYNGEAWVGLIAFYLSGIRLRGLPPVPFTSRFVELNLRIYVIRDGQPGVYFLSLDASNALAGAIARSWFRLGYLKAQMSLEHQAGQIINFTSRRTEPERYPAQFAASYCPSSESYYATAGTLEYWLTERYRFYTTDRRQRLYSCDVAHEPWPLQKAEAEISCNTMAAPYKIALPSHSPLLHYARTMKAIIWPLKRV